MKGYVIESFGTPEVFKELEIDKPIAGEDQLLIEVAATSVNPLDCKLRSGLVPDWCPSFPAILHSDVAGTVVQVGKEVSGFAVGDKVYACAGGIVGVPGALADFMVVDPRLAAKCPQRLSLKESAALPLVAITAWDALVERAKIQPGEKVLIHGGTGGVGHISIQLAKYLGAKVYATCGSREKAEQAMALGADGVINYNEESVEDYVNQYTDGEGFDVVFDTVGGEVFQQSQQATRVFGRLVSIMALGEFDVSMAFVKGISLLLHNMMIPMVFNVGKESRGEILRKIAAIVDEGNISPIIDPSEMSISQVAEAHERLESGLAIGKIVLTK